MDKKIKKIESVSIQEVWPKEDKDFTNWLRDNIDYLSDVLDIDLDPLDTEVRVSETDRFKVDIVALDPNEDRVAIENQYGPSDHKHLGQLLTYIFNLEAKIGIWICEEPRQSHIEVIDKLNEFLPMIWGSIW